LVSPKDFEPPKAMGLLLAIEIIKICFVSFSGFYSINRMSGKYDSLL